MVAGIHALVLDHIERGADSTDFADLQVSARHDEVYALHEVPGKESEARVVWVEVRPRVVEVPTAALQSLAPGQEPQQSRVRLLFIESVRSIR